MSLLVATAIAAVIIRCYENNKYFWVLAWPGTVMHELMHYVVALVTFAQPSSFSVIPVIGDDEIVLGSVDCDNLTWFNRLPIALAPILGLGVALLALGAFTFTFTVSGVITAWIIASVVAGSWPSSQDFRVGFGSPIGVAAWAGVIYLAIR